MVKKVTKKKNRRLRRQIRKTMGCLLLASSIIVAALPVPEISASNDQAVQRVALVNHTSSTNLEAYEQIDGKNAPLEWRSNVPFVDEKETIYTTADSSLQFAYINYGGEWIAVILGRKINSLPGGTFTIPAQVDGYRTYDVNMTNGGLCAVGQDGSFLYYQENEPVLGVDGKPQYRYYDSANVEHIVTESDLRLHLGEGVYVVNEGTDSEIRYPVTAVTQPRYYPCYQRDLSKWENIADEDLYYLPDGVSPVAYDAQMDAILINEMETMTTESPEPAETPTATPEESPAGSPEATESPSAGDSTEAFPTVTPVEESVPTVIPTEAPTATWEEVPSPTKDSGVINTQDGSTVQDSESDDVNNGFTTLFAGTPTVSPTPTISPTSTSTPSATPTDELSMGRSEGKNGYEIETVVVSNDNTIMAWNDVTQNMSYGIIRNSNPGSQPSTTSPYIRVGSTQEGRENHMRIHNADVRYIGRQYLSENTVDGTWKIAGTVTRTNPERGVFARLGQLEHLITEADDDGLSTLIGIGDYAFYGCTSLQSVDLANGLNTLGNGAFEQCLGMTSFTIPRASRLEALGKDTFSNCRSLRSITIPANVRAIGDYCFQNCVALETIEMGGDGTEVALNVIGWKAFENCTKLSSITFPGTFTQTYPSSTVDAKWGTIADAENNKIPITWFEGCDSLQYIKIQNNTLDIVDDAEMKADYKEDKKTHVGIEEDDINKFLARVPELFYFEGPGADSVIRETAKMHSAAFKYMNADKYEKVTWCEAHKDENGQGIHEAIFAVDSNNQLVEMTLDPECGIVDIPAQIGSRYIDTIGEYSFDNSRCALKRITIPSTVREIAKNAFRGCHRLEDVIFLGDANGPIIGENAFDTQDVQIHNGNTVCDPNTRNEFHQLTFTGNISPTSNPFLYAMDPGNNYNNTSQVESYITFYSGWPSNLTVQYNKDTDKNELINYPTIEDLKKYAVKDYEDGNDDDDLCYPYLTEDNVKDAQEGAAKFGPPSTGGLTGGEQVAVNGALNINLPAGIESIKAGLFSGVDSENESVVEGEDPKPNTNIQSVTLNSIETVEPYTFAGCTGLARFYMAGGNEIGDYAFKDCGENLVYAEVAGSVTKLGIRPFAGCTKLTNVDFKDSPNFVCENSIIYGKTDNAKSSIVECLESKAGIITAADLAGVQSMSDEAFKNCSRINEVDLSETEITEIPYQAFAGSGVNRVVLPNSTNLIEKGAFWNCEGLYSIYIPNNLVQIAANAFAYVQEGTDGEIELDEKGDPTVVTRTDDGKITILCNEGSAANIYANMRDYNYIKASTYRLVQYVIIPPNVNGAAPILVDSVAVSTDDLNDTENWSENKYKYEPDIGNSSRFPEYQYDGYHFEKWGDYTEANGVLQSYAQYSQGTVIMFYAKDPTNPGASYELVATIAKDDNFVEPNLNDTRYEEWHFDGYRFVNWTYSPDGLSAFANYATGDCTVTFIDVKNTSQRMVTVSKKAGETLTAEEIPTPADPEHFTGWEGENGATVRDRIYEDITFYAGYSDVSSPGTSPSPGGNTGTNGSPSPSGNNGNNGNSNSSPSASPTATPTATPDNSDGVVRYTVSVSGGSGSGSYPAGAVVAINAYYRGEGQEFDRWTTSTAGVGFANPESPSTTFTMPAANVAITATYKTGGSGTAATNTSGGGNAGNTVTGAATNNGTRVDVTRPGISNTNLAGATVSGATDNFVVKVTEDQSATDAATAALQARFGDLSRIKYFPMDISLYDSTGRTKIADTSGISVNLTLPLPDELVQYAGNNKIAAIAGGALEDLNARFTTIDGVPCINFTATHFSPYVIYVDTANLTEATIDATPKTGDPIHPKWFLALGMACVSLILFFKRDKIVVNA